MLRSVPLATILAVVLAWICVSCSGPIFIHPAADASASAGPVKPDAPAPVATTPKVASANPPAASGIVSLASASVAPTVQPALLTTPAPAASVGLKPQTLYIVAPVLGFMLLFVTMLLLGGKSPGKE